MKTLWHIFLGSFQWLFVLGLIAFAAAAVYFCSTLDPSFRIAVVCLLVFGSFAGLLFGRTWKRRFLVVGPLLAVFFAWYLSLQPKMDAPWGKDVAVLPEVDLQGDLLTVRNIRNFHYRSDTDFDVAYYDKVFDLSQLRTVDLFLSYWGTTAIAHTVMSFGFANGDYLPISIETRKEVGESYSAVQGFFKKYELFYVMADERDVIGVRVNQRNEDVYLYRLKPKPAEVRKILLDYIKSVEELEHTPIFYNALTTNCTTSILPHIRAAGPLKLNWALLANGYLDRWRYDQGVWGFEIPFDEFRKRSHINDKVKQFVGADDFSARIREGLPSIKP